MTRTESSPTVPKEPQDAPPGHWAKVLWIGLILLVAAPLSGALKWWHGSPHHVQVARSLIVVAVVTLVVLGLLWLTARGNSVAQRKGLGYLQMTLGADGRISTSKTVVYVWTLCLALALTFLSALVWFNGAIPKSQFAGDWSAYFLLLGGPFAAAVAAKGITAGKVAANPDAKSSAMATGATAAPTTVSVKDRPQAADVVNNDAGDTDLVDTQYVVFSLVVIAYFIGAFVTNIDNYANGSAKLPALPVIPSALLGLTSLAALTYVGNKQVVSQGLRIVAFKDSVVGPGDGVTIFMVNLTSGASVTNTYVTWLVPGQTNGLLRITVGVNRVDPKKGEVEFVAPMATGDYQITVVAPDSVAGPLMLTVK